MNNADAATRIAIRKRSRRGYLKEANGYSAWEEWQVVQGRKVIGRHEHRDEALKQKRQVEMAAQANGFKAAVPGQDAP